MLASIEPVHKRRRELEAQPEKINEILSEGMRKAQPIAAATMKEVRAAMGLE